MDVSKLFEPGEIRRLSKDETIALYKRHMMAQYERAESAEAEVQRLREERDKWKWVARETADNLHSTIRDMLDACSDGQWAKALIDAALPAREKEEE